VSAPKTDPIIRKIDFVQLSQDQLLVVIVSESGQVENRVLHESLHGNVKLLRQLSDYTSEKLIGHTLSDGINIIEKEIYEHRSNLDQFSSEMLKQGLEAWKKESLKGSESVFLKGHANLLDKIEKDDELCNIRDLFDIMETKSTMLQLLDSASKANGVQVFIGSENPYFKISGCSLVLSPYKSSNDTIIGAVGVIGPANMKYREVIPLVNYTSKIISKLLDRSNKNTM
jgi:heat-inducible transcriptional repressor